MRRAQKKAEIASVSTCPECNAPAESHRACKQCGMYRGRKVLTIKTKDED
ncbi:MAG: 50S ribosomal protein L32 [Kiritimatiellia bacterium]|jgi:large subunit ribosomal protein L32